MTDPDFNQSTGDTIESSESRIALGRSAHNRLKFAIERHLSSDTAWERSLIRIEIPYPAVDSFEWLGAQTELSRMYWRGRHADDQVAMCGAAVEVSGEGDPDYEALAVSVGDYLDRPGAAEPRFYGGMRFDVRRIPEENWFGFPSWKFALPRFELHRRGARTLLCCNLVLPEDREWTQELLKEVDALRIPEKGGQAAFGVVSSRQDNPGFDGWKSQVNWTLDAFDRDVLEKVVLARRVDFRFEQTMDPTRLLGALQEATPNCFHFLFESGTGAVFTGATPERLFFRRGREVFSEAVAGTRPRGATDDDDRAYRAALLSSEKDQREHAFVRECIRSVLQSFCEQVTVDETASEMRLAGGRHLYSRLSGTLDAAVTDFDLLKTLHPTPAVGGHPGSEALEIIASLEDFDRGWYAGPVGWMARDSAEFAVALRCGVVQDETLTLFSGAGLVKGSEPGSEWLEIEQKITDFTRILGLVNRP